MITELKEDPDWVWSLKAALRPHAGNRHIQDIRVFSPNDVRVKNVKVESYTDLDSHPELILYAGTFNKSTGALKIKKPAQAA